MEPFARTAGLLIGGENSQTRHALQHLAAWPLGVVRHDTDPRLVPFSCLEAMGTHPMVYIGERAISGLVRRPNLFSVRHEDPQIRAEVEEWLWPLLCPINPAAPSLLASAARGFSYGCIPGIFDWTHETLQTRVPRNNAKGTRPSRVQGHTHFASWHEVRPSEAAAETPGDTFEALHYGGTRYDASRSHVWCWDGEFGSLQGQGARRRAWRPYCQDLVYQVLQGKYLERSVHAPLVGWVPSGSTEHNGEQLENSRYMLTLGMGLRGGGMIVLPSKMDDRGNRHYGLEALDLPERDEVWHRALSREDVQILLSFLVPPQLGGIEDLAAAAGRVLDGMLREFIQDLADWIAAGLTRIVQLVHPKNHDPERVPFPEIEATDIGKREVRKVITELLKMVSSDAISTRLDVAKALDTLGVPILDAPDESQAGNDSGSQGRPRDLTSDREERRDNAITDEGEEDTGAARDEDGELESAAPAQSSNAEERDEDASTAVPGSQPAASPPERPIFGYHLQAGVVEIDEARAQLQLGPAADGRGKLTVPAYLASLRTPGEPQPDDEHPSPDEEAEPAEAEDPSEPGDPASEGSPAAQALPGRILADVTVEVEQ